jgi:hypothetical protein
MAALWDRIGYSMGLEEYQRFCQIRIEALNYALNWFSFLQFLGILLSLNQGMIYVMNICLLLLTILLTIVCRVLLMQKILVVVWR